MIRWGALLSTITLLLAGCAAERSHPVLPLPGIAADGQTPAPDVIFTMRDGFKLPARVWAAAPGVPPRGIILALHGFTDSRDWFEYPAPAFTAAGYSIVSPDQRGFGATADRGGWAGAATLVDDAQALQVELHARHPDTPLVVMGESMGGAVALCLAARPPAMPAAANDRFVLLAPAVWGRAQMGSVATAALWIARGTAPGWTFTGSEVPSDIAASDNRDALIRLGRDPLTLRSSSVATLAGLVDLMDAAQDAAPHIRARTLILDGRRDQIVPPSASAAAWSKLPPTVRRGFYPNGFHLLLRDRDRAVVEADILSWLATPEDWLPSGADAMASSWQESGVWTGNPSPFLPANAMDGTGLRRVWPY